MRLVFGCRGTMSFSLGVLLVLCIGPQVIAGSRDRIKLKEIDVLTLYSGQYTTARRSHPVLQLQCTGGTAGCNAFVPRVVQCYNRGSDGYDVQWECKTDMDNAYRFGQIAVTCEGYDYPDDPYVLRGSCGLEYQLDLTKEGYQHQYAQHLKKPGSCMGYVAAIFIVVIALIVIGRVVRAYLAQFWSQQHDGSQRYSYAPPPYPGDRVPPTAPPPPGFRSEYMPSSAEDPPPPYPGDKVPPTAPPPPGFRSEHMPSSAEAHYSNPSFWQSTSDCHQPNMAHSSTGSDGRFWTGVATGGILGYLFGSRIRNRHYRYVDNFLQRNSWFSSSPPHQPTSSWWSSGANSDANWSTSGGNNNESTGTRTASGFGGTRRR